MAQVTLYLDEETARRARRAAKAAGLSQSRWLAELGRQRTAREWPAAVRELAGTWETSPRPRSCGEARAGTSSARSSEPCTPSTRTASRTSSRGAVGWASGSVSASRQGRAAFGRALRARLQSVPIAGPARPQGPPRGPSPEPPDPALRRSRGPGCRPDSGGSRDGREAHRPARRPDRGDGARPRGHPRDPERAGVPTREGPAGRGPATASRLAVTLGNDGSVEPGPRATAGVR